MVSELLDKLADKTITKEEVTEKVKHNFDLLPEIMNGISSHKPAIRYGCGRILMDLSEEYPDRLYPNMDFFVELLNSKYRILTWNAMAIIANLTKVDTKNKFDSIFEEYYSFLNDEYMVTVANLVGNSGKIAKFKPNLTQRITSELLKIENISTTPHLTEECKRIIAEKAIKSFDVFFDQIENKDKVISFIKRQQNSSRRSLKNEAERFLNKWTS